MRRLYWPWMVFVFGIIGTAYGTSYLTRCSIEGKSIKLYGILLFVLGIISLLFSITVEIARYISNKKHKAQTIKEEAKSEETPKEEAKQIIKEKPQEVKVIKRDYEYTPRERSAKESYSAPDVDGYIKLIGYGPLVRIHGNQILDMRNNTYYHIEGNMVNQDGYGPRFEIRNNQIRDVYGGYLYEISGNNINKVFGGFYASISGNYITLFDGSQKYEMTDSFTKKQILAIAALLFGSN